MSHPRWRSLLDLKSPALAAMLSERILGERSRLRLETWAGLARVGVAEVAASPFGARMVALGLEAGAMCVHRERRRGTSTGSARTRDPLHDAWLEGTLRTGKYDAFTQEEPFSTYDPSHSAKWLPHEFLHRAVGFVVSRSPFERYVASRLNELLPVATWYGLEQLLRLREPGPYVRGRDLGAPRLEDALWLELRSSDLRRAVRRDVELARWTLERTAQELALLDGELASGTIDASRSSTSHAIDGARLDASSDALAYVVAHRERLDDPRVDALLRQLSTMRVTSARALRSRVDAVLDRLLFDPLVPDPSHVRALQARNAVLDLALRCVGRPQAEAFVFPRLATRRPRAGSRDDHDRTWLDETRRALDELGENSVAALGEGNSVDRSIIVQGLRATFPRTWRALTPRERSALTSTLVEALPERTPFIVRVLDALSPQRDPERAEALRELTRFEASLVDLRTADPREALGEPWTRAASLVLDRSARLDRYTHAVHRLELSLPPREDTWIVTFVRRGERIVLAVDEGLARRLALTPLRLGRAEREELLALGLVHATPSLPSGVRTSPSARHQR